MNRTTRSLCFALAMLATCALTAQAQFGDARRIVFLGDSITYAGDYVTDVACWLEANGSTAEVVNLGVPSETASDLTEAENAGHVKAHRFPRPPLGERLARVLAETKPDLLFACYGMNDGSSLPADDAGLRRYQEAIGNLRTAALQAGVRQVVLITPPVFDARAKHAANDFDPSLTRYTDWLLRQRDTAGWRVVDVHGPMRAALDTARLNDPAFVFSKDGVHPGREGHALMARAILTQFGGATLAADRTAESFFAADGQNRRKVVAERMALLRDAWLTQTRHTRPGLKAGLPLPEAEKQAAELTRRLRAPSVP